MKRAAATLKQNAETAQQKVVAHLVQAERGLYSGNTQNPKELAGAERDVAQLKRQLGHADDELLEALLATEAAMTAVTQHAADVQRLTAAWQADRERYGAEQVQVKARLEKSQQRQAAARRAVRPDLLVVYDSLRPRRAGRAVSALDGDECGVCGVAVPQSKLELVREDEEIVYCGNCGRVLWEGD